MSMAESELVQRSREGDQEAFGQLVLRYEQKVYNLAYRFTGNADDAQDLAQEAFVKAFLSLADFRGQAAFGTWLHRIVSNLCLDELRRRRRHHVISLDEAVATNEGEMERQVASNDDTPAEAVERRETQNRVQAAIATLDDEFRMALVLCDIEGYSYNEIAHIMDCPLNTVRSRIHRARKLLKERLQDRELFAPAVVKRLEGRESR